MDPRRVLLFRTVARAGSLSRAARDLGWTQPAVSQQLQRLEREAGCTLLLRGSKGVTLTEAGEVLLRRADAIAGELHVAGEELAGLTSLSTGRVRLVAFPSAAANVVPEALALLAADRPGLEVAMVEAEPPEGVAAVLAGEADLALAFEYDGPPELDGGLEWHPLLREPVLLVVPNGHPVAGRRAVRLADLRQERWVGGCERCRGHLVARCRAAGFEPRLAFETDDYVAVQNLVARGLGVTLLPRSALTAYTHPGVEVRSSKALGERHIGLVHRVGADGVPATRALVGELRRAVAGRVEARA